MKNKSLLISLVIFVIGCMNITMAEDKKVLYKTVDKNGNVSYSDKPTNDSKEVPMREGQSINMKSPKVIFHSSQKKETPKSNNKTSHYSSVSFLQPENNGVIRNNGSVALFALNISPKLDKTHHIVFYIDGVVVAASISGLDVTVSNLEYGSHTASFVILDNRDREIAKSETLSFNLLHTVRRKVGVVNNNNSPINNINTDVLISAKLKINLPEHPKPVSFEKLKKREN